MKKFWMWGGLAGVASALAFLVIPGQQQNSLGSAQKEKAALDYRVLAYPSSLVYTLTIPPGSGYTIRPFVSEAVETVAQVAKKTGAVAVLNAGFFDPVNQKTTSRIVQDSRETASPQNNERLMQNPKLTSYLSAILNRSEFRQYRCAGQVRYDIGFRNTPVPAGCELAQAIAAGPQLLPNSTAQQEGFTDEKNGVLIRDAIGSVQRNARSAIGITDSGSVVWVMIAQRLDRVDSGMTLAELASVLQRLGARKALNLDGGSSASLYFKDQTHYGKLQDGKPVVRPVKSTFLLQRSEPSPSR